MAAALTGTALLAHTAGGLSPPSDAELSSASCIMIWTDVPPGASIDWRCLGVCPLPNSPGPIICIFRDGIIDACIPPC